MHNLLINCKNIIINGRLYCTGDFMISDKIPENLIFYKTISTDMYVKGDILIEGTVHIITSKPLSTYKDNILSDDNDIFYNVTKDMIQHDLHKNFNKFGSQLLKSDQVYILLDNFKVGNNVVSNYYPKKKSDVFYLSLALKKIKTKKEKKNTIIK